MGCALGTSSLLGNNKKQRIKQRRISLKRVDYALRFPWFFLLTAALVCYFATKTRTGADEIVFNSASELAIQKK